MQFARVAHATDFLYCYSIIESNRRSDFAPSPSQSNASIQRNPQFHTALLNSSVHSELNTFFPFDPYKLPRSSSYIEGVYREWSSVAIDDEEEDDESEAEAEGDEEKEEDKSAAPVEGAIPVQSRESATDSLDVSFGGMSISPGSLQQPPMSVSVSMSVS